MINNPTNEIYAMICFLSAKKIYCYLETKRPQVASQTVKFLQIIGCDIFDHSPYSSDR